jgi:hypothetical protein
VLGTPTQLPGHRFLRATRLRLASDHQVRFVVPTIHRSAAQSLALQKPADGLRRIPGAACVELVAYRGDQSAQRVKAPLVRQRYEWLAFGAAPRIQSSVHCHRKLGLPPNLFAGAFVSLRGFPEDDARVDTLNLVAAE